MLFRSMLLIFIILCVTTLSVLSLSSARADLALAKRNQEMQMAYSQAAVQVQAMLAKIDAFLLSSKAQSSSHEEYERLAQEMTLDVPYFEIIESEIRFDVDAGFERRIEVILSLTPHGAVSPGRYQILRHALCNDAVWETEEEQFVLFIGE